MKSWSPESRRRTKNYYEMLTSEVKTRFATLLYTMTEEELKIEVLR